MDVQPTYICMHQLLRPAQTAMCISIRVLQLPLCNVRAAHLRLPNTHLQIRAQNIQSHF